MIEEITTVSQSECLNLLGLFKRKKVLERVRDILNNATDKQWENNYESTNSEIERWWKETSEKYCLTAKSGAKWTIDFHSGKIYLITE